jgi:2-C-methyl-D-erythritol 4-phosphate cytidylyltransferase/2-C-methyl-D-erythritol 2,4-cyclodiphosphate synthase
MKKQIAQMCNISEDRVSIKATTTEKLGFIGREEGIAAQAIVTINLPLE